MQEKEGRTVIDLIVDITETNREKIIQVSSKAVVYVILKSEWSISGLRP